MKTKTFSILFALVMILSLSAGVLAVDYTETWDEETVLTVFNDVDIVFPDLFADIDSDFLFVSDPDAGLAVFPSTFPKEDNKVIAKDLTLEDLEAKALADTDATTMTATYDPCGDGLVKFDVTITKKAAEDGVYYGPSNTFYIRDITATVDGTEVMIKKCSSTGGDDCRSVKFNAKGVAHVTGYLYVPAVMGNSEIGTDYAGKEVVVTINYSKYMTALWDVAAEETPITGTAELAASKNDYCQATLVEKELAGITAVRARYDENTGEARFQATIANDPLVPEKYTKVKANYVIPADVLIAIPVESDDAEDGTDDSGDGSEEEETTEGEESSATYEYVRYTDYTCKYTIYNTANAAPRTDYCKFGEGIAIPENAMIRFDITVDHIAPAVLNEFDGEDIPFVFRVGGMPYFVGASANGDLHVADYDGQYEDFAAFTAVDYPCPVVSRMSVMDPLKPFMTFYGMETDNAIEPSGAYGVYEGGVWGMYQKCGRFAYMAVRLQNDGKNTETINLNNVAVAINGGTPMEWSWVLTTVEAEDNKIELASGQDVVLFLRAKVTDLPYQLNSDVAMTGAVNFLDYGFYITGKVYSDHNNTNCTVAP